MHHFKIEFFFGTDAQALTFQVLAIFLIPCIRMALTLLSMHD